MVSYSCNNLNFSGIGNWYYPDGRVIEGDGGFVKGIRYNKQLCLSINISNMSHYIPGNYIYSIPNKEN